MVDEMFLQKETSYQTGDYVGEDEEGELYKGIACFMIVGLKQSVPHVIQAKPEVNGWLKNFSITSFVSSDWFYCPRDCYSQSQLQC